MAPSDYSEISAVHLARTREQFEREVFRFTRQLGFDTYSALTLTPGADGKLHAQRIDNAPEDYKNAYLDKAAAIRDPVLRHCRSQMVPLAWDQSTYTEVGAGDVWTDQAKYGYRAGIAIALHLPSGQRFLVGVNRAQELPQDPTSRFRLTADLSLFAMHAAQSAFKAMKPAEVLPQLTPREIQALQFTATGSKAAAVASLMGISERTATMHLNNAMHKLGATSKYHAVATAQNLGLIPRSPAPAGSAG